MVNSDVNEEEFKLFIDATRSGSLVDFQKYYKKEYLEKEFDDDGWRPLHYASVYGQLKIAIKLIEEGCDIDAITAIKWCPIHYAARYGQAEIVQVLVDKGCNYEARDRAELRPIHHACKNGCTSVAKILIENDCDIEPCDAKNWRPIHYACINGYVEITHLLIEGSCNIDARTPSGQSPIDMAKQKQNQLLVDIINAEIKNPKMSSDRKFLMACQQGNFSLAEFMITRTCNIEICDNDGKRSIHWACLNGHTEIVRLLVKNQCDIDACDNLNQSPIVLAKKNGNQPIIEILNLEISHRKSINQIFESIGVNCGSIRNHYFSSSLQSQSFDKNDLIGFGGFGRVYQYILPNTTRTCAIKAIPNDIIDIQIVKEHINKSLRNLQHSSIVQIYGAVEKPKHLLIFMELLNGGSLNDKLIKEKSIALTDAIRYSFQCFKGLEFLHEIKHIIHRDIKPSNILLDSENNAKLADFDLSRLLLRTNGQTTSTKSIVGTAYFMAPEIFRGENYSFSADIWSFGITFFKMITGIFPFDEAEFPQIVINRITNTHRFEIPTLDSGNSGLKIFVENMLNPNPSMRPSASDLLKHKIFFDISS